MFYTLKEVPVFQFTNSVMYLMEEEHVKQTRIMYRFCRTLDHFFVLNRINGGLTSFKGSYWACGVFS